MQRDTLPLPRTRHFSEKDVHAVRAESSWVDGAPVMQAPQEGIVLEGRRAVALLVLRYLDTLGYGGLPTLPQKRQTRIHTEQK